MSRQIQIRRGTAAEHDNFTGAIGEVTMDTTNKTLRVHDGVTVGGNKLMLADGFKSNITNCITEIPENIKLELNSGTLKLKAGSKIWIPNGKDAAQSNANLGSNYWTYIFYTGTEFIAIAKDGYFSWSQDGINWTQAVLNETITTKQWRGIAYGLGMYVAVGTNGYISTSTDGHTWTAGAKKYGMGSNAWKAVACDGTKFVAIAQYGHISTSTNGTTWSTAVEDANLGYNNWATIFYDGTKFIALSNTGYISTSTDGTTWAAATAVSNLGNRWWRCMAFNGSKYVAIADQGWISTSVDGTTWTAAVQNADLGYGNGWIAITWDGTKFVAIGERGAIASSPDGESWGEVLYSQITIQNDITVDTQSATGKTMLLYNHINGSARADVLESACISGTTPLANNMLYNTFTNVIDYYNGSLVAEGNKYSFPLAMISVSNGSVTSIDNIFNGFGYFGSTVFALPGIKYLLPNGRKDNGGLNSTESAVQTILINS